MKNILTCFIIILIFVGACQYSESEIVLSEDQLVEKLKNDPEFSEILKEVDQLSEKMFERLEYLSSDEIEQLEELENIDDFKNIYSFSDLDFSGFQKLNEYFHNMNEKYPPFKKINPEKLIAGIEYVREQNDYKNSGIYGQNYRIMDSCDDEFKKAMKNISDSYKTGLSTCAIVTMATAGGGFVPCMAGLIINTLSATARAMDAHTLCKQNQA